MRFTRPLMAVAVIGSLLLAGCSVSKRTAPAAVDNMSSMGTSWQEMDKMHEDGIKAFPAKTQGKGNQLLQPQLVNGVKVFTLTVSKIKWEVTPGQSVDAYAYNGMVPGPTIRVTEGDRVRVIVKNDMNESTGVHWHGLRLENEQDGVPFITQPPIKPGETFTYEFSALNPGTHMYHSHHNSVAQVTGGLLGALIIDPKDPAQADKYGESVDNVMVLDDGALGFVLNGKGFPATEPLVAKLGQKVRIRFMNAGQIIHPMHLHGFAMTVVEKDGYPLPQPYKADTLNVAPGERYDVIVDADTAGTWAFHCHILSHAESQHGMHGMVTALIVQK